MRTIVIEIVGGVYTLHYWIRFHNRKKVINSKKFNEWFDIPSINAIDFTLLFLEKFGKPTKLKRKERGTPKQVTEIFYELSDKREEQLYILFKLLGGSKRKIYKELFDLLNKSIELFDKKFEEIAKGFVVKEI